MKKKLKETTISVDLVYGFDGRTVEDVIEIIRTYKRNYPELLNWRFKGEYGYDHSELHLVADRLETDVELATRVKKSESAKKSAKKRKAKKELAEIELLEKLKAKYEKGNYKKPK